MMRGGGMRMNGGGQSSGLICLRRSTSTPTSRAFIGQFTTPLTSVISRTSTEVVLPRSARTFASNARHRSTHLVNRTIGVSLARSAPSITTTTGLFVQPVSRSLTIHGFATTHRAITRHYSNNQRGGGSNQLVILLLRLVARGLGRGLRVMWRSGFAREHPALFWGLLGLPAVAILGYCVSSLQQIPYSGRMHLVFLSDENAARLGDEAYAEAISTESSRILPKSDPIVKQVTRISEDIIRVCTEEGKVSPNMQWEVNVIESSMANAFVLPNGKIFVYTGILPVAKNEAGLATILGHEVSHALAKHAVEKIGIVSMLLVAGDLVEGWNSADYSWLTSTISFLIFTVAQFAIPLAHSRKCETEADHIGLLLTAKAGYNPAEASKLWERMQAMSGPSEAPQWNFLSTHPAHEDRIANMLAWLPMMEPIYEDALVQREVAREAIPKSDKPLLQGQHKLMSAKESASQDAAVAPLIAQWSSLVVGQLRDVVQVKPHPHSSEKKLASSLVDSK